jgi:hypothetical protein
MYKNDLGSSESKKDPRCYAQHMYLGMILQAQFGMPLLIARKHKLPAVGGRKCRAEQRKRNKKTKQDREGQKAWIWWQIAMYLGED